MRRRTSSSSNVRFPSEEPALSNPTIDSFDFDDLEWVVTDDDKLVMVETILAWADLDTGVSRLTYLMFGLDPDFGSILIGTMDLKTKVERMKMLYDHLGNAVGRNSMGRLITAMREYSACRNAIAHRKCIGRLISDPARLVFLSARHIKAEPGRFEMLAIDRSEMVASAEFARKAAVTVAKMIDALDASAENGGNS
jgi:hypothetical protein